MIKALALKGKSISQFVSKVDMPENAAESTLLNH